jgi:predicted aspartyl protease
MPVPVPPYTDRYAWGSAKTHYSNRPYTWMRVHGPKGVIDLWALIDTGADFLMLENSVATTLGIALPPPPIAIKVAGGGSVFVTKISGVQITVEGKTANVDALFFGGTGTSLLGRTAILSAIEFGIDNTGWLYR